MESDCKTGVDTRSISEGVVLLAFVVSEILPFIKGIPTNGWVQGIARFVISIAQQNQTREAEPLLDTIIISND